MDNPDDYIQVYRSTYIIYDNDICVYIGRAYGYDKKSGGVYNRIRTIIKDSSKICPELSQAFQNDPTRAKQWRVEPMPNETYYSTTYQKMLHKDKRDFVRELLPIFNKKFKPRLEGEQLERQRQWRQSYGLRPDRIREGWPYNGLSVQEYDEQIISGSHL